MAQRRTVLQLPRHGVRTPENRNAPTLAYLTLLSMPSAIDLNMEHECPSLTVLVAPQVGYGPKMVEWPWPKLRGR